MKTAFLLIFALAGLTFGTACHTAHRAVEDTEDLGAHAVHKTGHAIEHGVEKAENL